MFDFTNMREEFSRLHKEATAVVDAAAKDNREFADDEKKENEKRFTRMTQIKNLLDEQTKFAELAIAGNPTSGTVQKPSEPEGREALENADGREQFALKPGDTEAQIFQKHRAAINHFIRTGQLPSRQFVLTTATGTNAMLPTQIGRPVVIKRMRNPIRAALVARGLEVIRTDDMGILSVPVFDDSANTADVIAQDNTSENNKDPSTTALTLGADLYDSGTVWSSNTLLGSLSFDLLAYLEPMLAARIEAAELAAWAAALAAGTVGKTTATTNGVTYAELLDWQHSIPVARRADGVFILNDGLYRAIRGLVDDHDHPIYQESLRDDAPNTLLGWPVFPTDELDTPAAGAVSGVAASAESLVVRDVNNRRIARYTNIPTHPDQFGIRMFSNGDFAFVTSAVRTLKHAAS